MFCVEEVNQLHEIERKPGAICFHASLEFAPRNRTIIASISWH